MPRRQRLTSRRRRAVRRRRSSTEPADPKRPRRCEGHQRRTAAQQRPELGFIEKAAVRERRGREEERDREADGRDDPDDDDVAPRDVARQVQAGQPRDDHRHRDADRFARENRYQHEPRPGPGIAKGHAGIRKTEEEQHDGDRALEGVLEFVQRVVSVRLVDKQSGVARGVRHERHDRHERQRRVQPATKKANPRQNAGGDEIRPERLRAASGQPPGHQHAGCKEHREVDRPEDPRRIEGGDDEQAQCVIRNRQQQQKGDGRMLRAEHDARDEIAERDVGGTGNGPAPLEIGAIQRRRHPEKDQRRPEHPSHRGGKRHRGASGRMERPSRRRRLGHLLRRKREEEHHPDVVDEELNRVREAVVAAAIEVAPDERENRADDEQAGVVDERFCRSEQFCRQRRGHRVLLL